MLALALLVVPMARAGQPKEVDLLSGLPDTAVDSTRTSVGILPVVHSDDISGLVRKPESDLRRLPPGVLPLLIGVRYSLGGKPVEYLVSTRPPTEVVLEGLTRAFHAIGHPVVHLPDIPLDPDTDLIAALKAESYDPAPDYVLLCVTRALAFDIGPFQKGYGGRVRFMTRPHLRAELTLIDLAGSRVAWQGVISHWYDSFGDPYESAGPGPAVALVPVAFADFLRDQIIEQTSLEEALQP